MRQKMSLLWLCSECPSQLRSKSIKSRTPPSLHRSRAPSSAKQLTFTGGRGQSCRCSRSVCGAWRHAVRRCAVCAGFARAAAGRRVGRMIVARARMGEGPGVTGSSRCRCVRRFGLPGARPATCAAAPRACGSASSQTSLYAAAIRSVEVCLRVCWSVSTISMLSDCSRRDHAAAINRRGPAEVPSGGRASPTVLATTGRGEGSCRAEKTGRMFWPSIEPGLGNCN